MDKYEKMLRKIVDNAKFYPIIQLEEYNRNLQYDYTKKTCVDYIYFSFSYYNKVRQSQDYHQKI